MRIFVCEYITGGGLVGQALPPSLAHEGELMLRALVDDLTAIPGVEVVVSRDPRLSGLPPPAHNLVAAGSIDAVLDAGLVHADAVWLIAPESDATLERLARRVEAAGVPLLGCSAAAVCVAASKEATARALESAGIPTVPTCRDPAAVDAEWVVLKPDDGAGCLDTRVLRRDAAIAAWTAALARSHVAQPWVDGDALSLSLLCADGRAELLCCNRQHVSRVGHRIEFGGVLVNVDAVDRRSLSELAAAIAHALPGLWGYVGVDMILAADGPRVVDINPRLTTAYAGLGRALGINVADRVLGLRRPAKNRTAMPAAFSGSAVDIRTDHEH